MMAEKLYVAVISDILDSLGFRNQALQPGVVPAQSNPSQVLVGRAATLLVGPQYEVVKQPYTNQIAAIDALEPGDVVVSGVGGMTNIAVWGELFSNAAKARGARGFRFGISRLLAGTAASRYLRARHRHQYWAAGRARWRHCLPGRRCLRGGRRGHRHSP